MHVYIVEVITIYDVCPSGIHNDLILYGSYDETYGFFKNRLKYHFRTSLPLVFLDKEKAPIPTFLRFDCVHHLLEKHNQISIVAIFCRRRLEN